MNSSIVCNMNCACVNNDCSYKHYLNFTDRKKIVSIINKFNLKTSDYTTEDNVEKRKANCTFGFLCFREDCLYKHRMNNKGRKIIIDNYNLPEEKKEIVVIIKNKKEPKTTLTNKFSLLEEVVDDVEEEIKSIPTVNNKLPPVFNKSYSDVLKTNSFDIMMSIHHDDWADYE